MKDCLCGYIHTDEYENPEDCPIYKKMLKRQEYIEKVSKTGLQFSDIREILKYILEEI